MKAKEQLLKLVSKNDHGKYQYLSEFFKYLPDIMVEEFHYLEVKKNEKILFCGETAEHVYIMLDGKVKGIDYHQAGCAYSFIDFSKMYILGDFELFSERTEYMISIYAKQDCKLLRISAGRYMKWLIHDENALYMRLKNVMGILTSERMLDRKYLSMGCRERVINVLVMFYENNEKDSSGNMTISITQNELSEMVGFNIRSVQRVLASLEEENLIAVINRKTMLSYDQYLKLINEIN